MKEQTYLPNETPYSVTVERQTFVTNLIRQVVGAVQNAPQIHRHPITREIIEFRDKAISDGTWLKQFHDSDTIDVNIEHDDHSVILENPHDYPLLLTLAIIVTTQATHNVPARNVKDWLQNNQTWAAWYEGVVESTTEHESGHFLPAEEFTSLHNVLGVSFFQDTDGTYNFLPFTDSEGKVRLDMYREAILQGPRKLSRFDSYTRDAGKS